ncbi:polysaccharide deacetylase family protein [Brasilonema octagenarum]|uniref:Polysaccharide deacetylase family protein n=1 Tax=Brasilonema octagenarum UFV-OR1 TaxID=417115 RepID=A0ABX1MBL6_9CYAN|nr:polysaccharide deacetylase family protein [Brasilonema octagenarum UFV-OR1]
MNQKNQSFPFHLILAVLILFFVIKLFVNKPVIPIFGFHGVLPANTPTSQLQNMHYPEKELEKVLEHFVSNNYWFLTTQELYDYFIKKHKKVPKEHSNQKPIMISFDDGYQTVHTNLLPILSKLENKYSQKIKVVLFINPGIMERKESTSTHLDCQDLREGLKKGFYDIQSHGFNHKNLMTLSRRELVKELQQAQIKLRQCTQDLDPQQQVASHLAYPYGASNKQVRYYASKYYLSAYLYNDKILDDDCKQNYYEIPRIPVNRQMTFQQMLEIAEGFQQDKSLQKCEVQ